MSNRWMSAAVLALRLLALAGCTKNPSTPEQGTNPSCEVTPGVVTFGDVALRDTVWQLVQLTNLARSAANVTISSPCSDFFMELGDDMTQIEPGGTETVSIGFAAENPGPRSCTLSVGGLADCGRIPCAARTVSGTLEGLVHDETLGPGAPLPGILVTLPELGIAATTDREGRYRFAVVPPDRLMLEAEAGVSACYDGFSELVEIPPDRVIVSNTPMAVDESCDALEPNDTIDDATWVSLPSRIELRLRYASGLRNRFPDPSTSDIEVLLVSPDGPGTVTVVSSVLAVDVEAFLYRVDIDGNGLRRGWSRDDSLPRRIDVSRAFREADLDYEWYLVVAPAAGVQRGVHGQTTSVLNFGFTPDPSP